MLLKPQFFSSDDKRRNYKQISTSINQSINQSIKLRLGHLMVVNSNLSLKDSYIHKTILATHPID